MHTMLTHRCVFDYLVKRELLSTADAVDDDLAIVDISRRNHNFKVLRTSRPGFVLKQSASLKEAPALAHEAATYQLLQSALTTEVLDRYFVRSYGFDATECVLVLALAENSMSLDEFYLKTAHFPVEIAAQIGRALAALHTATREPNEQSGWALPWVFRIDAPPVAVLPDLSGANIELLRIVQSSKEFCQLLAEVRQKWRVECTIHGDMRSSNCIVIREKAGSRPRLKLIDWELAMEGDPAWDVGSVLQDYLAIWINSIPVIGDDSPERFLELASYPLEKMQPALRRFWHCYRGSVGVPGFDTQEFLIRAVEYAGVRLVQNVYEQAQHHYQLVGTAIYQLQVSLNILQRPYDALVHLFGIPLTDEKQ